jgi:hypothetical protein
MIALGGRENTWQYHRLPFFKAATALMDFSYLLITNLGGQSSWILNRKWRGSILIYELRLFQKQHFGSKQKNFYYIPRTIWCCSKSFLRDIDFWNFGTFLLIFFKAEFSSWANQNKTNDATILRPAESRNLDFFGTFFRNGIFIREIVELYKWILFTLLFLFLF